MDATDHVVGDAAASRPFARLEVRVMDAIRSRGRAVARRLPARWLMPLIWAAWMPFALQPTLYLLNAHSSAWRSAICLAAVAAFFAIYLWAAYDNPLSRRFEANPTLPLSRPSTWPIWALATIAVVVTLAFGNPWLALFIFTGASIGPRCPSGRAPWLVLALTTLAVICGFATGADLAQVGQAALLVGGIGLSVTLLSQSVRTVLELRAARAEVARLAVSEERLRFARDLHDLLGHSLSLIALKCDLARQLAPVAPDRAAREIADAESVAREALREVREAVAGYRQTSVAAEVAGAREVLAAAGIGLSFDGERLALPPELETVLAWTVREGVTNVIRHSRAEHCAILLARLDSGVELSVSDNGSSAKRENPARTTANTGHGLTGVGERAAALGGRSESGALPGGGFRLAVWLPLAEDAHVQAAPASLASRAAQL